MAFDTCEPRRRLLLLHNPRAGRAGRARVDAVVAALGARGAAVVVRSLDAGVTTAHAVADAAAFDAVVAAGGDGTLRSVLTALAGRDVAVGLVPVGTGNVFAHEVGLSRGSDALAEVLLAGPAVRVTGARANGVPFFLMAGAGFDGGVIGRLDGGLKSRVGKLAYVGPVLRGLAERPEALEVVIDGRAVTAEWVVVARCRCYGGGFVLAPGASLLTPGLVAVVFAPTNRAGRIARLAALAAGRLQGMRGVSHLSCAYVSVTAARPVPVEVDGDAFGATPLVVDADGPAVRLVVPATYLERAARGGADGGAGLRASTMTDKR